MTADFYFSTLALASGKISSDNYGTHIKITGQSTVVALMWEKLGCTYFQPKKVELSKMDAIEYEVKIMRFLDMQRQRIDTDSFRPAFHKSICVSITGETILLK